MINFIGVGFSLYGLASMYQWVSHDPIIKHTVKCQYCRKSISDKVCCTRHKQVFWPVSLSWAVGWLTNMDAQALRCVNCTSWQDGREDKLH